MITNDLNIIIQALIDEEIVAIPTETVYGLATSIFSKQTIKKIFSIKNRPYDYPLSVAVKEIEEINYIAKNIPHKAQLLIKKYLPGPLTLILEKQDIITNIITAGSKYVGVRVPDNRNIKTILSKVKFPIVLTSANIHNYNNCTNAYQVQQQIGNKVKYIFDGGECKIGKESTIISFQNKNIQILRKGAINLTKYDLL